MNKMEFDAISSIDFKNHVLLQRSTPTLKNKKQQHYRGAVYIFSKDSLLHFRHTMCLFTDSQNILNRLNCWKKLILKALFLAPSFTSKFIDKKFSKIPFRTTATFIVQSQV